MFCVPVPDRSGQVTPPVPTVAFVLFNNTLLQVKSSRGQQSDQQRSLMDQIMLGQQQDDNKLSVMCELDLMITAFQYFFVYLPYCSFAWDTLHLFLSLSESLDRSMFW